MSVRLESDDHEYHNTQKIYSRYPSPHDSTLVGAFTKERARPSSQLSLRASLTVVDHELRVSYVDVHRVHQCDYLSLAAFNLITKAQIIVTDGAPLPAFLTKTVSHAELLELPASHSLDELTTFVASLLERYCHLVLISHEDSPRSSLFPLLDALSAQGITSEAVPGVGLVAATMTRLRLPHCHEPLLDLSTITDLNNLPLPLCEVALSSGMTVALLGPADRLAQVSTTLKGATGVLVTVVEHPARQDQHSRELTLNELGNLHPSQDVLMLLRTADPLDSFGSPSVIVTREEGSYGPLSRALRTWGARVVYVPTLESGPPDDGGESLKRAAENVHNYQWIVFTSSRSVDAFLALISDHRTLGSVKIAAIGRATAKRLLDARLPADLVPERFSSDDLLACFPQGRGAVCLPQSQLGEDTLARGLAAKGWQVDRVDAYTTRAPTTGLDAFPLADCITFASPSSVKNFLDTYGKDKLPSVVCSIGPSTTSALQRSGISPQCQAEPHTLEGLSASLKSWWVSRFRTTSRT